MTATPRIVNDASRNARPLKFTVVGAAAFCVHFAVVALLVPFGVPPLAANVAAFVAAFAVSFSGHARFTFRAQRGRTGIALRRFAIVAVAGFVLNETSYAALLADTTIDYRIALLLVLGAVATLTYVAARDWAFAEY
jgi:putative flippase GtrA